jgi:hypothetical protein
MVFARVLAVAVLLSAAACTQARPDPLPGYRPALSEERIAVMTTLSDYFAVRNLAAVTGDLAPLYTAHPSLAHGEDRQVGVNVEAFFVERMRSLRVSRVSVDLEAREPVKVYVKDAAAVAYVHGRETWDLSPGSGQTISEVLVRFDLRRATSGWLIERTDELVLGERVSPTPR